jgi:hypothetical protein
MPASHSRSRGVEFQRPARKRRPLLLWILVAVLVFAAGLVFVLPASMASAFLPRQVRAEDFSGTLLHGAAGKFSVNARDAGAIEWHVHPLALLRLAVVADIHWVKVGFVIDGTTEIDGHGFEARGIKGGGPIENLSDLGVAAGWRGSANLNFADVKSDFTSLKAAEGKIEVANLSSAGIAEGSDLGSYVLALAPGAVAADGTITAGLNDTGGPLELQAQLRFAQTTRTGMLSGTLEERSEISPALRAQIDRLAQLQRRDAAGKLPVELEFTF